MSEKTQEVIIVCIICATIVSISLMFNLRWYCEKSLVVTHGYNIGSWGEVNKSTSTK